MNIFKKALLVFIWISFILVPYSFFAYLCYLGLCGGEESREVGLKYGSFYGYFFWLYFIIVIASLIASRLFTKANKQQISLFVLFVPIVSLLPFLYVTINVEIIHSKYENQRYEYNSPHADDFVCAPGKFIRMDGQNRYLYFDYDKSYTSGSTSYFNNKEDLLEHMRKTSIDIYQCKNKSGKIFQ